MVYTVQWLRPIAVLFENLSSRLSPGRQDVRPDDKWQTLRTTFPNAFNFVFSRKRGTTIKCTWDSCYKLHKFTGHRACPPFSTNSTHGRKQNIVAHKRTHKRASKRNHGNSLSRERGAAAWLSKFGQLNGQGWIHFPFFKINIVGSCSAVGCIEEKVGYL